MTSVAWASIINLTIGFAVPLLLVALGGMYSERSGVINIALDGIMIIGALASCLVLRAMDLAGWGETLMKGQLGLLIAVLVAGVSGMVFSLLLAFAAINLKADQTIGGTALNIFAPAFSVVIAWAIQGQGLTDIAIPKWATLTYKDFGISGSVKTDFFPALFKKFYITIPIAIILLVVAWFVLYRTRFGLRLRACGEHPQAADSVGINVYKMRYAGVMIFGNWNPGRILFSAIFFALFKVVGTSHSLFPFLPQFSGVKEVSCLYNLIPYIFTLILLIFTSKKSRAPKAEGIPYDKGQR